MGTHDFKYNKVPLFSKNRIYQYFDVCCPEISSCVSKPVLLRCNIAYDFKYNMVPLFGRKPGNINTSMSAAPKLALVPASRYYCHVT